MYILAAIVSCLAASAQSKKRRFVVSVGLRLSVPRTIELSAELLP